MVEFVKEGDPIPDWADFVIKDPRVMQALEEFSNALSQCERAYGSYIVDGCGLPEGEAIAAMADRLLAHAATLSCANALAYLGRDPDPERWRAVTDRIFAAVAPEAKRVFEEAMARTKEQETTDAG